MASLDLLYLGRLRDAIGRDIEPIDPPSHVLTVEDLIKWLGAKGEPYASALTPADGITAAVDREWAQADGSFFGAREVALFPPMGAL